MTTKLPWYKRYPEAALAGMKALTLEERGAYNTVLDLIYFHGGELDDDDQLIAGWCSCDVRIWKRIKVRLLALDKLVQVGGKLRNLKADVVLAKALAKGVATPLSRKQYSTKSKTSPDRLLETRITDYTVSTSGAPVASAGPDGPPRRIEMPESAKWRDRLDGYEPWAGKRVWKPFWGPLPDQSGSPNPSIPAELLSAWRAKYRAAIDTRQAAE